MIIDLIIATTIRAVALQQQGVSINERKGDKDAVSVDCPTLNAGRLHWAGSMAHHTLNDPTHKHSSDHTHARRRPFRNRETCRQLRIVMAKSNAR